MGITFNGEGWFLFAKTIRERDHNTCVYCGEVGDKDSKGLPVTTFMPFKKETKFKQDYNWMFITLCQRCLQKNSRLKNKLIKELRTKGKSDEEITQIFLEKWRATQQTGDYKQVFDTYDVLENILIKSNNEKNEPLVQDDNYELCVPLGLTKTESEFFVNRRNDYYSDFAFNNSSDKMLLNMLIWEELLIQRLYNKRFTSNLTGREQQDIDKALVEANKRYDTISNNLNVNRKKTDRESGGDTFLDFIKNFSMPKSLDLAESVMNEEKEQLALKRLREEGAVIIDNGEDSIE